MKTIVKINLLFCIAVLLFSCHSTENAILKPSTKTKSTEQYGRELFKKYKSENYNKWQELNKLLKKNFIAPGELNVIDCRGFNPHSKELVLKKALDYYILGKIYSWNEYETDQGRCIQLNTSVPSTFFLSQLEASILLSASLGNHFKELKLDLPKILYKKTILNDLKGMFCGGTTMVENENMIIYKGGCKESIYYKYETKRPPKNPSPIQFTF